MFRTIRRLEADIWTLKRSTVFERAVAPATIKSQLSAYAGHQVHNAIPIDIAGDDADGAVRGHVNVGRGAERSITVPREESDATVRIGDSHVDVTVSIEVGQCQLPGDCSVEVVRYGITEPAVANTSQGRKCRVVTKRTDDQIWMTILVDVCDGDVRCHATEWMINAIRELAIAEPSKSSHPKAIGGGDRQVQLVIAIGVEQSKRSEEVTRGITIGKGKRSISVT